MVSWARIWSFCQRLFHQENPAKLGQWPDDIDQGTQMKSSHQEGPPTGILIQLYSKTCLEMFPEERDSARHSLAESVTVEVVAGAGIFVIVHRDAGL